MRSAWLAVALIPACFLIFVTHRFVHEERMVDDCISARHGSFDYTKMSCDLNENHPYVAYSERHPADKLIFWVSSSVLVLCVSTYASTKKRGTAVA